MNIKIPFESEIKFDNSVKEITKMSLEEDYSLSNDEVLGNFYISGEYKTHDISIDSESFNFTLPFSVTLTESIKEDSLEFIVEDFTYELLDNTLKVNIEYSLSGELKETIFERVDESTLEDEINYIDEFMDKDREINKTEVIKNTGNSSDTYVTYKIHIVKERETMESISKIYNIPITLLEEYNELCNYDINDKIIIPEYNE